MAEPIVSLDAIQRRATGHCQHALHHRAPRVRRAWPAVGSMTREAWHNSTNSPARHVISNLLVSITRTRSPVGNVFSLIAVRELLWKGASVAWRVKGVGRDVFMSSVQLCCESAMTGSSFFSFESAPLLTPKNYGSLYETLL